MTHGFLFGGEVVGRVLPLGVMLADVVFTDCLLEELSASYKRVDGGGCGVRGTEECCAVGLADESSVGLDGRT